MKVIFLGLMFSDQSLDEAFKFSQTGVQMATHVFQKNLTVGLRAIAKVHVVNVLPVGSFPLNYKKLVIRKRDWEYGTEIGYVNIPVIKHLIQKIGIYRELKKLLDRADKNYVLIYSLYQPFLEVVEMFKNQGYNINVTLIQTDAVPGRNDMARCMTKSAIRRGTRLVKLAKVCDSFVLLSKYTAEPLEVGDRPYIILECICNEHQQLNKEKEKSENICLYTGTLEKAYGITDMVDAFKNLQNAQLWICGSGNTEDYIIDACKKFPNIRYYGFVDAKTVMELRDKCDFLINPRRPEGTYTLYSFPSKTAEYLISGKPTIMYKLEAIPDEYDKYINYIFSDSPYKIAEEINAIFNQDYNELKQKAKLAREYMIKEKNGLMQANRVIELMSNE